jgi:hypothetical protein
MTYQESLELLARSYTYTQIQAQTGVPPSTISYVISGERELPEKYGQAVTAAGYFRAYQELRDEGAGNNSALIIAGESLSSIDDALYDYQRSVEMYAKNWLTSIGRSKLIEEEGKLVYYNLDKAITKWAYIIGEWNITYSDIKQHEGDTWDSDPDWIAQRKY